jgi:hypothetical protein
MIYVAYTLVGCVISHSFERIAALEIDNSLINKSFLFGTHLVMICVAYSYANPFFNFYKVNNYD